MNTSKITNLISAVNAANDSVINYHISAIPLKTQNINNQKVSNFFHADIKNPSLNHTSVCVSVCVDKGRM